MTTGDGDRRVVVDAVRLAIARSLPRGYRGVYAQSEAYIPLYFLAAPAIRARATYR